MPFWCSEISLPRDAINSCFISKKNNMEISHGSWMHPGSVGNKSLNSWTSSFWGASRCSLFSGGSLHRSQQRSLRMHLMRRLKRPRRRKRPRRLKEIGMRPGFFWRVGNGWNVDVLLPQSFINRVIYKLPIIVSKSPRSECMWLYVSVQINRPTILHRWDILIEPLSSISYESIFGAQ